MSIETRSLGREIAGTPRAHELQAAQLRTTSLEGVTAVSPERGQAEHTVLYQEPNHPQITTTTEATVDRTQLDSSAQIRETLEPEVRKLNAFQEIQAKRVQQKAIGAPLHEDLTAQNHIDTRLDYSKPSSEPQAAIAHEAETSQSTFDHTERTTPLTPDRAQAEIRTKLEDAVRIQENLQSIMVDRGLSPAEARDVSFNQTLHIVHQAFSDQGLLEFAAGEASEPLSTITHEPNIHYISMPPAHEAA